MRLLNYVAQYVDTRDVSSGYLHQLLAAAKGLERFCKAEIDTTDLNPSLLNSYLRSMKDAGCSAEYRKSRRRMLLTLWTAAADDGLAIEPVRRKIMIIGACDRVTTAWTIDEVRHLFETARTLDGIYRGVARYLYWPSYIAAAWDSGLRGCDLRSIERPWIRESMLVIQRKTGKRIRIHFRRSTLALITAAFPPDRALIWPRGCIECWRDEARAIIKKAGLSGSIGRLRHSSGTAAERERRGHGHEHLGNTRTVFEKHYLDSSQIDDERARPPELFP